MTSKRLSFATVGLGLPLIVAACGGGVVEDDPLEAAEAATSKTIALPSVGTAKFSIRTTAKDSAVSIVIDCHPPSDPDLVGATFSAAATSLGISATPARAGRWSWTGPMPTGTHSIVLTSTGGGAASCSVKVSKLAASRTCRAWSSWRSTNTNHTHLRVGTEASDWELLPASGNHWGAWAAWTTVYDKPIKRGYLLHNLEHGGLVLSYKCNGASESTACADAEEKLIDLANEIGDPRVIVTPDPTQPEMFAVRAWREVYSSSCLDVESAKAFGRASAHHGREDADSNPPIPFDPTTTNVPCWDLMAAPDSCPQ